jgi:hypothetical protein
MLVGTPDGWKGQSLSYMGERHARSCYAGVKPSEVEASRGPTAASGARRSDSIVEGGRHGGFAATGEKGAIS